MIVALIIGSTIGGAGGATIISAASASRATHERTETAQRETLESASSPAAAVNGVESTFGS